MKDIKKYFTASLFPYLKGDFDSVEFEKRCLTSSFCDCILYATQKSLDEANDSPELDVRTKTSFIHSRFYRNVADFFAATYTGDSSENAPQVYYSAIGNERNYILYNGYVFIFNIQSASKNQTNIHEVIQEQQSEYHILAVEYILDITKTTLTSIEISYNIGKNKEYIYRIPNKKPNYNIYDSSDTQTSVQPILPKLKKQNEERQSS